MAEDIKEPVKTGDNKSERDKRRRFVKDFK